MLGHVQLHLVPRQVGRELLATGFFGGLLPPLVARNRLQGGIGDPLGRIDDVRRVAEVEHELLRVRKVSLDLLTEGELQGGVPLLGELRDLDLLVFQKIGLLLDQSLLIRDQRVACGEIVRQHHFLRHARNINTFGPGRNRYFWLARDFFR